MKSNRIYNEVSDKDLVDRPAFLDAITDLSNKAPSYPLPLSMTGVNDHYFTVTVGGFSEGVNEMVVSGFISAGISLPGNRRGAHMSRFVESIYEVTSRSWPNFSSFLGALVKDVQQRQAGARSHVAVTGKCLIPRKTPVTGQTSHDCFCLLGDGQIQDGFLTGQVGLRATIITACPCTQAYSWYSSAFGLADSYGLDFANDVAENLVTFTHSQRATVTVWVDAFSGDALSLLDCYTAICQGAHVTYELLKRTDEHHLVRESHLRPQFSEDVVRDVAAALVTSKAAEGKPACRIKVESTAVESIHSHGVHAVLEGTVGELKAQL